MKFDLIAHDTYTTIRKKVGKKILEIDTRRPSIIYMQYGYSGGVGPWHSTSAIHYEADRFGYDTPDLWDKRTRKALPAMIAMAQKLVYN